MVDRCECPLDRTFEAVAPRQSGGNSLLGAIDLLSRKDAPSRVNMAA